MIQKMINAKVFLVYCTEEPEEWAYFIGVTNYLDKAKEFIEENIIERALQYAHNIKDICFDKNVFYKIVAFNINERISIEKCEDCVFDLRTSDISQSKLEELRNKAIALFLE